MARDNTNGGFLERAERCATLLESTEDDSLNAIIGETSVDDATAHETLSHRTKWHEDPVDQNSTDANPTPTKRARTNVHIHVLKFDILEEYGIKKHLCGKPLEVVMKSTISNTMTDMIDCKASVLVTMLNVTAYTKDGKLKTCRVQDIGKTLMEILCMCCSEDKRWVGANLSANVASIQPIKFEISKIKKVTATMQQTSIKDYIYIIRNLKDLALVGADYAVGDRKATDGESRLLETGVNGTASIQKLLSKFLSGTCEEMRHHKAIVFKALYVMHSGIPLSIYDLGVHLFKILMALCTTAEYTGVVCANLTTTEYAGVVCAFRDLLVYEYTRLSRMINMDEESHGRRADTPTETPVIPLDTVNAVVDVKLLSCMRDLEDPRAKECEDAMSVWIQSL